MKFTTYTESKEFTMADWKKLQNHFTDEKLKQYEEWFHDGMLLQDSFDEICAALRDAWERIGWMQNWQPDPPRGDEHDD